MKSYFWRAAAGLVLLVTIAAYQQSFVVEQEDPFATPRTVSQTPVTIPQSPGESLKSFRLPKGYRLEVVASEPMISEPAALTWDGNGRMYVAQLETYMQTIDAQDEYEPRSRIMLLEDTDSDGKMDKSSVFIDKLLAPRMLQCVGRELLVNETNSYDIYAYQDTNGDGKADRKRPVYQHPKKAYGNVEHQRSGLDWNLDNWLYVTTDPVRFRYQAGQLKADTLVSGSNGQWGLTHDNYGRLFFSRAASGIAASGFQINPVYGQLDLPDALNAEFSQVWPLIKTPDVNGGPRTLRPDSTMFGFTSVSGQSVFRGDRLPASMAGDYIVPEPVGRFIRRANITDADGRISLTNVYKQDEFIASTDMNFRPVNTYTGPDGCLYIVDMYRGVIQEATWAQPGSYLYDQIMSKGLQKNVKRGRIYRLVHEDLKPGPLPRMLDEPGTKLVTYLDHPNGWWRDNAQKELVVRGDKTVVPALRKKAVARLGSTLGRLHALWTLEGLEALDQPTLLAALKDTDVQIRKAAVRMSEPYLKKGDPAVLAALQAMATDPSRDVLSQVVLSLSTSQVPQATGLAQKIVAQKPGDELLAAVQKSLEKNSEARRYGHKLVALDDFSRQSILEGATIFNSLCASCHGPEGQGLATNIAPPLIGKFKLIENKEEVIKIMLHGLKGPVDGHTYTDQMPPMGTNSDEWIASVLNYVRYDLCMRSFPQMSAGYINWVIVKPEQVRAVRQQTTGRTTPWTWEELFAERDKQRKK
ncbi:DUF7133 domain-containing protein [Telluribacter sp.]|jgi:glucose/arabinose dehydrogenase/mono/diheme cytochrome c family protein|uniref:DUF7133 domain-containing protein n=1 Tax=Telluribacter sp. TaxID=1978767 RepID=UPI002E0D77E0|nr:HEAT repeat domain-containing protein [Telluribacter sp.]